MLILHLGLIWGLVALHVVGGAVLFNRLFPRESPWFGFIVPSLALVLVMNFIEHEMGFSTFEWALPVTFLGSLGLIVSRKTNWRRLWLPTTAFLAAFALTTLVHGLKPDVEGIRDGRLDMHIIADYSMGGTLPPISTWEFPFRQLHYYSLEHYAASVMLRLFGFDIGTGFNMAAALLSAFIFVLIGAIAWRLGRHQKWIVALSMLLTASAMSGSTAYLWLLAPHNKDPDDTSNLFNHGDPSSTGFPFDHFLKPVNYFDRRELLVPGYWGWIGSFHSTVAGQFLTLLAVYCLVEMVRRRQTILPWIGGLVVCLLMVVCSTWGLPFMGLLFLGGVAWCLWKRIYPRDWRVVMMGWGVATLCLSPLLSYYLLLDAPGVEALPAYEHTQLAEFVIQWWPVYLPWFALLLFWRRLSPATGIVMILAPSVLLWVEYYTVSDRLDMTGKIWGYLFGALWAVLIPSLAVMRSYVTRGLLGVFMVGGVISICFWVDFTHRTIVDGDEWRMAGLGDYRTDAVRGRILGQVATMNYQVILTGKSVWAYNESPSIVTYTHNYGFIADDFDCDNHLNDSCFGEGKRRADAVNAIYDGKNPGSLAYLHDHHIAAMVIWPDDQISNDAVTKLKSQLAGSYWYADCRESDAGPDDPNGGVFLPKAAR